MLTMGRRDPPSWHRAPPVIVRELGVSSGVLHGLYSDQGSKGHLLFLDPALDALTLSVQAFKSAFAFVAALVLPAAFTAAFSVAQGPVFAGAFVGALP